MRVFVTGGCGQIGSHITELLLERGDDVMVIDNLETGRRIHLPDQHANLTIVEGTIADRELVRSLLAEFRPEVIVHAAASYKDPDDWHTDMLVNGMGGVILVQAAREFGVGRFVYFQTALTYGVRPLENPITLDHPKDPGNSSYAISKTVAEDYLQLSGLDYVTFRLANVIGPRNTSGPLPIFYERLKAGKKCFVTAARRDFVFVRDLAPVVVRAAGGAGHGAYHFSSGTDVAVEELYDAVVAALKLNAKPEPDRRPLAPDEAPSILLDPSKTFADFGEIEFTPLDDVVAAAVAYYDEFGAQGGYTHLKHDEDA